jgi:hypothetical protein
MTKSAQWLCMLGKVKLGCFASVLIAILRMIRVHIYVIPAWGWLESTGLALHRRSRRIVKCINFRFVLFVYLIFKCLYQ